MIKEDGNLVEVKVITLFIPSEYNEFKCIEVYLYSEQQ